MPVNGYNTGKDVLLVVQTPSGTLRMPITNFQARPGANKLRTKPISGPPVFGKTYDGWSGTFKFDRNSPDIDTYFANEEAAYWRGENVTNCFIQQTVNESNGSTSQFKFPGVCLYYDDPGDYSVDKLVSCTVSFDASTREKVI